MLGDGKRMLSDIKNGTFDDVYRDTYWTWRERDFNDVAAVQATLDFMDATFLKLAPEYAADYKTWYDTP